MSKVSILCIKIIHLTRNVCVLTLGCNLRDTAKTNKKHSNKKLCIVRCKVLLKAAFHYYFIIIYRFM